MPELDRPDHGRNVKAKVRIVQADDPRIPAVVERDFSISPATAIMN